MKKIIITGTGVVAFLVAGFFVFNSYIYNEKQADNATVTLPSLSFNVPDGWYAHRLNDTRIILTKQEELPDIGTTEGYAYGEQINVSTMPFNGDAQQPEDWGQLKWTEDEVLVRETLWTYVDGTRAFRVRHDAGGVSGEELTWHLFTNDRVHMLSLYPIKDDNMEVFEDLVYHYAEQLGQNENARKTYTNEVHGFSFAYPSHWHEDEDNSDDLFQIRNYDVSKVVGGHGWGEHQNKIEGVITSDDSYGTSSTYPEEDREQSQVTIDDRDATRYDIVLENGTHIRSYVIPLQNEADEYVIVSIYGDDTESFHVLEHAMDTFVFENG